MNKRQRTATAAAAGSSSYSIPGCSIVLCPEKADELYANDKLYKYKIIHLQEKLSVLTCHALFNNVCAFFVDIPAIEALYGPNSIASFSYVVDFEEEDVKGKKKKTALKLKAGQTLCKITFTSDEVVICRVPINVQLLEINTEFSTKSDLFWDAAYQRQYVAIAYPTFTLPDLEIVKSLIQQKSMLASYQQNNHGEDDDYEKSLVDQNRSVAGQFHHHEVVLISSIPPCLPDNLSSLDQISCDELDAFKNTKDSKLCFEFAKSGTCKHGDRCKFVHM